VGEEVDAGTPMSYALMVAGLALCLLGVLTNGPLGMSKILSRRAHAMGDGLVAAGLALSPLIVGVHHLDLLGVGVAEIMALVLIWVSWSTSYATPVRPKPAPAGTAPSGRAVAAGTSLAPVNGVTPAAGVDGAGRQQPSTTDRLARAAGRGVKTARDGAKALEPRVGHATNVGARKLGMAVGSMRRARVARAASSPTGNGKPPQQGGPPG
jgi:hypothetical protein